MNNISMNNFSISDHHNTSYACNRTGFKFIQYVVDCTIVSTGLPLTLVAIVALFSQVRNGHVAPIYVINLLISDLIQLCCLIKWVTACKSSIIVYHIYYYGVLASVGFMVCISLERYLVIVWPLWYRFRQTIKVSVVVCVVVWTLPLVYILPQFFPVELEVRELIFAVYLLLPFPLFIFFLGGTLKALSASLSVPSDEKRRIVAILVAVLLIYTLLFLPGIIWSLTEEARNDGIFITLVLILFDLSPLADLILYIFIRKGAIDKILASLCCCRMENNQEMSSVNTETMHSVSCRQEM